MDRRTTFVHGSIPVHGNFTTLAEIMNAVHYVGSLSVLAIPRHYNDSLVYWHLFFMNVANIWSAELSTLHVVVH